MNRSADGQHAALDSIRREIDDIDDGICELLERRFAAIEKVRTAKSLGGGSPDTPMRPAREAAIISRLVARSGRRVPPELLVRLWRALISEAIVIQAPVRIHIDSRLAASVPVRLMIQNHFGSMQIIVHEVETDCLSQVKVRTVDLALVATNSAWAGEFVAGRTGAARVIGCLPYLRETAVPDLLVFGHAGMEDGCDGETVVVSNLELRRSEIMLWQTASGRHWVSGLAGSNPVNGVRLTSGDAGADIKIAGHCASPLEVTT